MKMKAAVLIFISLIFVSCNDDDVVSDASSAPDEVVAPIEVVDPTKPLDPPVTPPADGDDDGINLPPQVHPIEQIIVVDPIEEEYKVIPITPDHRIQYFNYTNDKKVVVRSNVDVQLQVDYADSKSKLTVTCISSKEHTDYYLNHPGKRDTLIGADLNCHLIKIKTSGHEKYSISGIAVIENIEIFKNKGE